jgi:transposase
MTMTTMPDRVTGGVDTHLDVHVAAALNSIGGLLGVRSFPTTAAGYRRLLLWLASFGEVERVGVEGSGSYGAGVTRHLLDHGIAVVEVDRPNRQRRRRRGKSDPLDAISAARAAQSGDAAGEAKSRDGNVESIRVLRVARASARKARTQALNQLRSLISTAPDELRAQLRGLAVTVLLDVASGLRPAGRTDILGTTKLALRVLAQRARLLEAEIAQLDAVLDPIVERTAPQLVARTGVGPDTAGALLVAVGDNPLRMRSEASFAHLCGVAPIEASSGKVDRHRLDRGGDRQANSALWRIVITRLSCDPATRSYVERRMKEGRSKLEAIRCLKRYVARELYAYLPVEEVEKVA